jgi:hypothetical protein
LGAGDPAAGHAVRLSFSPQDGSKLPGSRT